MGQDGFRQARWGEPEVFDLNPHGIERTGYVPIEVGEQERGEEKLALVLGELYRPPDDLILPELSELEVVRHFTRLSQQNYGVDTGPVPLGSCTMKYNPRLALRLVAKSGVTQTHPAVIETGIAEGLLKLMLLIQNWMADLTGMDYCSLQPPAGASGELAGVLIMKKYFEQRGENRKFIIVPDSAHGSNPASAAMGGFKVIRVPTGNDGTIDLDALAGVMSSEVAGMMMTNPNTLGIFEHNVLKINDMVHDVGGLLYYDGANLNGILGLARPGDMGFDIVHINIHKTFSAPHGSGGPGAGVVCVKEHLFKYLPGYIAFETSDGVRLIRPEASIGDMQTYFGNIPQLVYATVFILSHGIEGLRRVALNSIMATNYFISLIKDLKGVSIPFSPETPRFHEVVLSFKELAEKTGISAGDVSKYLLDKGLHAPTIYFPLIVEEAFMVEFTETEPIESIEKYTEALREAVDTAWSNPEYFENLPRNTTVGRIDHVRANHPTSMEPSRRYARTNKK